jgi:hypothetical protein
VSEIILSMKIFHSLFWFPLGMIGCQQAGGNLLYQNLNECDQVAEVKQISNDKIIVCDPALLKDTIVLPLSYFTEELQILKMDDRQEAMISVFTFVIVGDKFVLVSDSHEGGKVPCKLFNKSGKFITNIGTFGKGPNEYQTVLDQHQLDEKKNRVYLLPWSSNKILVYDLEGNNFAPIQLPHKAPKGKFFVDQDNDVVTVFTLPFSDGMFTAPYFAWTQKISGKVIHGSAPKYLSVDPKTTYNNALITFNNTQKRDISFFTFTPRKDTLYHYDTAINRLIPQFTLSFKTREIPIHSYSELPHHYLVEFSELKPASSLPRSYISANFKNIVVEKKTLRGAYFKLENDFLGNIKIENIAFCFSNGYYVGNYDSNELLDILSNALANKKMSPEMREKLTELKNSMKETDNNYILYAKLKQ